MLGFSDTPKMSFKSLSLTVLISNTLPLDLRTYLKSKSGNVEPNMAGTLDGRPNVEPTNLRRDSGANLVHRRSWLSRSFQRQQLHHHQQQQLQEFFYFCTIAV